MPKPSPEKSLVLVVGAGASKEVNLPLGKELKNKIANLLDFKEVLDGLTGGEPKILNAFRQLAKQQSQNQVNIGPYISSSKRIFQAMPQAISIDNFIDNHRSDDMIAICAKLAIVSSILTAESTSKLFVDDSNSNSKMKFSALESTWLYSFFQLLHENCVEEDLVERFSKVSIICFNYDRCIEHYLHSSLMNYYGMNSEKATSILSHLEIYHPYGTVGNLPWQDHVRGIGFGKSPNHNQLIEISEGIRTFTEGIDPDNSEILTIRNTLNSAKRIAFLGFAFHKLNIELLFEDKIPLPRYGSSIIYGTALGISESDLNIVKGELSRSTGIDLSCIYLEKMDCASLLIEYSRSLSLLP